MLFFLSLLFCAQSDKGAGEQLGKSFGLPSRERLLLSPLRAWLKGGEKDASCPGLPQPAGAGTKGEGTSGRKGRGQAGERKEELRRKGRARSKNS